MSFDPFHGLFEWAVSASTTLRLKDYGARYDTSVDVIAVATLYPHLTANSYGRQLPAQTGRALTDSGIDMFLSFYRLEG